MMRQLSLTLPLQADESISSFVSRIAQFNKIPTVRVFCVDMGFQFQSVVDGNLTALESVARVTGVPISKLHYNAIYRLDDGWRLRGERMTKVSLRRDRLYVCPHCLKRDVDESDMAPSVAMYGRLTWQIDHFRNCLVHNVPLVKVAKNSRPKNMHDFALNLASVNPKVDRLIKETPKRSTSGFERYLHARLEGKRGDFPWLDNLEFTAAAKTCEMLGALQVFGEAINLREATDDQWFLAAKNGFDIASGGESDIRAFLAKRQSEFVYSRTAREGAQAQFGTFYKWLAFGAKDACFDPVRELLRRHIMETMPVGPGDTIFGLPIERRVLHSIRTASIEWKSHPKRIRKILSALQLIGPEHEKLADNRVLFDARRATEIAEPAVNGLSLKEAESYLGAGLVQTKLLFDAGFIKPLVPVGQSGIGENSFSKRDLDCFLEALFVGAVDIANLEDDIADIPTAARRANCGAMEIVGLILEKKLQWVGRKLGTQGYCPASAPLAQELCLNLGDGAIRRRFGLSRF